MSACSDAAFLRRLQALVCGSRLHMQKVSQVVSLAGHEDRVWCAAVSPDGSLIASCGGDKTIRIYSTRTHSCISVLEGSHSRTIRCVAWSPSGNHIAAASFDGTVSIWERDDGSWDSRCENHICAFGAPHRRAATDSALFTRTSAAFCSRAMKMRSSALAGIATARCSPPAHATKRWVPLFHPPYSHCHVSVQRHAGLDMGSHR